MPIAKSRILLVLLIVYIILDILLTPAAGLETRNPALVTTVGLITLGLLFTGLFLGVVSTVLLFYKPLRAPVLAMIAGILFLPAVITEQAGYFSSLRTPAAAETVELVQTVVSLLTIFVAFNVYREKIA
jgi:hypothetical protein